MAFTECSWYFCSIRVSWFIFTRHEHKSIPFPLLALFSVRIASHRIFDDRHQFLPIFTSHPAISLHDLFAVFSFSSFIWACSALGRVYTHSISFTFRHCQSIINTIRYRNVFHEMHTNHHRWWSGSTMFLLRTHTTNLNTCASARSQSHCVCIFPFLLFNLWFYFISFHFQHLIRLYRHILDLSVW